MKGERKSQRDQSIGRKGHPGRKKDESNEGKQKEMKGKKREG